MSILIDAATRVLVQGITGREGSAHAASMLLDGTKVVGGTSPKKAGEIISGVPVFATVKDAIAKITKADRPNWTIGFVPASFAKAAAFEALLAGLNTVIITEHLPVYDTLAIHALALKKNLFAVGPNCPGVITPGQCKLGIMPASVFLPGNIGVISRSGTLTYETVSHLTAAGLGQSTCVGIGGDPINLFNLEEALYAFEKDPATSAIVIIGEIGGRGEEYVAEKILGSVVKKPVVAFLAGRTAPPGKTLGHAGAIVERGAGTIASKEASLIKAGVAVAQLPSEVPDLIKKALD